MRTAVLISSAYRVGATGDRIERPLRGMCLLLLPGEWYISLLVVGKRHRDLRGWVLMKPGSCSALQHLWQRIMFTTAGEKVRSTTLLSKYSMSKLTTAI